MKCTPSLLVADDPPVETVPFVETSVSRLIFDVIDRAERYKMNALIMGAPGVGKSHALREALRLSDELEGPNVALITVTGMVGSSVLALLDEVSEHLGVHSSKRIAGTMLRIKKNVRFWPVVIFDEAQNMTLKAAREMLFISEEANVRMIFCGNGEMLKLVNSAQAAIQQISRRLPIREEIKCILDGDADLIASEFGVEGMDAYAVCRDLGRRFHADGIVKVLTVARDRAGESRTVRAEHIREAFDLFPQFRSALGPIATEAVGRARARQAPAAALDDPNGQNRPEPKRRHHGPQDRQSAAERGRAARDREAQG